MKEHSIIHRDPEIVNWVNCEHCNYKTIRKSYMKRHLLIHKGDKKHVCTHCDYRTVCQGNLKKHLRIHQDAEELDWLHCEHCNFKTIRTSSMNRHLLTHKGNKKTRL